MKIHVYAKATKQPEVACKQAPKKSGAKKKIGERKKKASRAWPGAEQKKKRRISLVEFVLIPPIHDIRFWYHDFIG